MPLFIPKRLIVKPQSKFSAKTREIIKRTHGYDPTIPIEYLPSPAFKYPVTQPREKFLYMKDSAIISERADSFIKTFDSPGNIVESLNTVLNLSWMCCYKCEYCYLQTNQTPEHYLYTNQHKAEHEIASAQVAHYAILTLWTHLSYYFNKRLIRLPDRFAETSDWMRDEFVKPRMTTDSQVIDRYYLMQREMVAWLNKSNKQFQIDEKKFLCNRELIREWYLENKAYKLNITTSEFSDFLGVDHLTGNSKFLMEMVGKYPSIQYTIRTKSDYVDELLKYDGQDRIVMQMSINTEDIIQQYEHGTATLDERIHAARKVQEATGYKLHIGMEPMIVHKGYINNYKNLLFRLLKELDPKNLDFIIFGSVRYAAQLKASVKMHYPKTNLLHRDQQLTAPIKPDTKCRYPVKTRTHLYGSLITAIRTKSQVAVRLGSEEETVWDALKLDKGLELSGCVYENIQKGISNLKKSKALSPQNKKVLSKKTPVQKSKPVIVKPVIQKPALPVATNSYEPAWCSVIPQNGNIIEEVLSRLDEEIPLDDLHTGMKNLEKMSIINIDEDKNKWNVDYWQNEETSTFQSVIQSNKSFKAVKIIGEIYSVSKMIPFNFADGTRSFITLGLTDQKNNKLETQLIDVSNIQVDIDILRSYKGRATFYGMVVPYYSRSAKRKNNSDFRFYLHDFDLSASDLDILNLTPTTDYDGTFRIKDSAGNLSGVPVNHPSVIIKNHPEQNGIITYIKNELAKNLKIVALGDAKELDRALEFVILQSLSQRYSDTHQKLHMLVIGHPSAGKSYLTKSALALNIIGQEITSSKMKVSAAGLIGIVKPRSSRNISVPGILPSNSGGVVCIQEFHEILGEKRKEVCGIFLRMMEEGKVIDSTSGNTTHIAETALLLDQNRYSDLYPKNKYDSYSDFDIPVPVLARFDHIMLIPNAPDKSKKVADEMIDEFSNTDNTGLNKDNWSNDLKYLVAFLKHEYRTIIFPDDIKSYIKNEFNKAIDNLPNVKELEKLVDNMRVRMMRSVIKISRTVATANATRKVTKAHVDYAMRFVQDKLDFIKSIHPADLKKIKPLATDITARQDLLKDQFYSKTFSTKEAHKFISESMEGTIAEKTITRDLQKTGAKLLNKKEGTWVLGQAAPEGLQKVTKDRRPKKKTTKSKSLKKVTKKSDNRL